MSTNSSETPAPQPATTQPAAQPAAPMPQPMHTQDIERLRQDQLRQVQVQADQLRTQPQAAPQEQGGIYLTPQDVDQVRTLVSYAETVEAERNQYKTMVDQLMAKGATPQQAQQAVDTTVQAQQQVKSGYITAEEAAKITEESVLKALGRVQQANNTQSYWQSVDKYVVDNIDIKGGNPNITLQNVRVAAQSWKQQMPHISWDQAVNYALADYPKRQALSQNQTQQGVTTTTPVSGMPDTSSQVMQAPGGLSHVQLAQQEVDRLEKLASNSDYDMLNWVRAREKHQSLKTNPSGVIARN